MQPQIQNIILRISSLALLLPLLGHAQVSSDTVVARLSSGQPVRPTQVSAEDRPQVILAIKKFLKDNQTGQSREQAFEILVALRDDETIRDLVSQYNRLVYSHDSEALGNAANPEIIPFLASDLSLPKDAGFRSLGGDVLLLTPRLWAVSLILRCISKSSEFPAPTQAWARSAHGNWESTCSAVDQWWTHNKDAIVAKRYSEATWLPPAATPASK